MSKSSSSPRRLQVPPADVIGEEEDDIGTRRIGGVQSATKEGEEREDAGD